MLASHRARNTIAEPNMFQLAPRYVTAIPGRESVQVPHYLTADSLLEDSSEATRHENDIHCGINHPRSPGVYAGREEETSSVGAIGNPQRDPNRPSRRGDNFATPSLACPHLAVEGSE